MDPMVSQLAGEVRRLSARLAAVEQAKPAGTGVSTAFGATSVRPMQTGFAAELTTVYDSVNGYSWKRLDLDVTVPGFVGPPVQLTGEMAFTIDDDRTLTPGTKGWLDVSDTAAGWVFTPASCCGWGSDYYTRYGYGATQVEAVRFPHVPGALDVSPAFHVTVANNGAAANLTPVLATALRVPAGTEPVTVLGRIELQMALSPTGMGAYGFTAYASVLGRFVTPGGVGSGAWSTFVGILDVLQGQYIDLTTLGGGPWYTGDVFAYGGQFRKSMPAGPNFLRQVATHDIELVWAVGWKRTDLNTVPALSGTLSVHRIGTGTTLTYTKRCCTDAVAVPQIAGPVARIPPTGTIGDDAPEKAGAKFTTEHLEQSSISGGGIGGPSHTTGGES